jgi:Pyruvate/2-oxoacid:ferredoxin oxidoreductase delta subunit
METEETMPRREIVEIDEKKCNGCGQCVPACAEGAIAIVDGKARLVSDVYCDGLGACLGKCPQVAIRITQRESRAFDEEAVRRLAARPTVSACPGAAVQSMMLPGLPLAGPPVGPPSDGVLVNWPIQLRLVPPGAPFLAGADVVLAADCAAFASADFHAQVLRGRPLLIACPKLDDAQAYVEKLAQIFATAGIRTLTVVRMEVPCCTGLLRIAQAAGQQAGIEVPLEEIVISTPDRKALPAKGESRCRTRRPGCP